MLQTLCDWLPQNLTGSRVLDAGCGTGLLTTVLAERGAQVVAVDLSAKLVQLAEQRFFDKHPGLQANVQFLSGDMLDQKLGQFDYTVAMDSLIHYEAEEMHAALHGLTRNTRNSVLFTVAPSTPMLGLMHRVGKYFPKSDRSPAIVPIKLSSLQNHVNAHAELSGWRLHREQRISSGFYKSHALELVNGDG